MPSADVEVARTPFEFACPICGKGDARPKPNGGWWVGSFKASCPGGAQCLRDLADAVGAPGGGALLDDPVRYLGPLSVGRTGPTRVAGLPTADTVANWQRGLLANRRVLRWLRTRRGLTMTTIRKYGLGLDGSTLVMPVHASGDLVNVRRREMRSGEKRGLKGRGSQLYPAMPQGRSVLLVAGELDALIALQHGLPAVTTTTGASLPEHLRSAFAGRLVAVTYDMGEHDAAVRVTHALTAAGARRAFPVDLRLPVRCDDITDWFVTYGRSARDFSTLLNRASRQASEMT